VTTIGLRSSCCADDRISAEVVLAGARLDWLVPGAQAGFFSEIDVPALYVHGDADPTIPIDEGESAYQDAPGPKAFVSLDGGAHSSPYDEADDPDAPAVRQLTTEFLRWTLLGDPAALARFRADVADSTTARLLDDALGS
jgi:fermentation-respiration switch protein FrsA (DUF1100 family)